MKSAAQASGHSRSVLFSAVRWYVAFKRLVLFAFRVRPLQNPPPQPRANNLFPVSLCKATVLFPF